MPVERVGRYQVVSELGRGAMGLVYKALDPNIGRTVALKTMRLDVHGLESDEMLRRFKNEARAAGVMSHPNIVTIYDAGEAEGLFYIAMEFIEGTTLSARLAERRTLAVEEVVHLSRQICAGLDYAHARGVIHRDVKPANVMLTADGGLKIMDFGIAKAGGGMTSAGQVLGTPNYMSPEQVKGKPLDGRSDLFSFGVMLYEMVTGEKPFTGQNVTTIIYKIVHEQPIPPRELDVTIHPGLSAIITRVLAKSPDERYQSGAELVRDLQNYKGLAETATKAASAVEGAGASADRTSVLAAVAPPAGSTQVFPTGALHAAAAAATARNSADGSSSARALTLPGEPATASRRANQLVMAGAALVILLAVSGVAVKWQRARQQAAHPSLISTPNVAPEAGGASKTSPIPAGELRLSSNPSGANVQIDGKTQPDWVTPFTASGLPLGPHSVKFIKAGYIAQARTVELAGDKTASLSVPLTPASPMLSLASSPPGAAIFIDNKDTGKVTPSQVKISKGEHHIALHKHGFHDAATKVQLAPGQSFSYAPTLQADTGGNPFSKLGHLFGGGNKIPEGKGMLSIRTRPDGAQVEIEGHSVPQKTPFKYAVDPGIYHVLLKREGYKTLRKTMVVEKGKQALLDETLQRQ